MYDVDVKSNAIMMIAKHFFGDSIVESPYVNFTNTFCSTFLLLLSCCAFVILPLFKRESILSSLRRVPVTAACFLPTMLLPPSILSGWLPACGVVWGDEYHFLPIINGFHFSAISPFFRESCTLCHFLKESESSFCPFNIVFVCHFNASSLSFARLRALFLDLSSFRIAFAYWKASP